MKLEFDTEDQVLLFVIVTFVVNVTVVVDLRNISLKFGLNWDCIR